MPAVELAQAFEPLLPAVTVPHVKIPAAPPPTEKVLTPSVVLVTVNVGPLT